MSPQTAAAHDLPSHNTHSLPLFRTWPFRFSTYFKILRKLLLPVPTNRGNSISECPLRRGNWLSSLPALVLRIWGHLRRWRHLPYCSDNCPFPFGNGWSYTDIFILSQPTTSLESGHRVKESHTCIYEPRYVSVWAHTVSTLGDALVVTETTVATTYP